METNGCREGSKHMKHYRIIINVTLGCVPLIRAQMGVLLHRYRAIGCTKTNRRLTSLQGGEAQTHFQLLYPMELLKLRNIPRKNKTKKRSDKPETINAVPV